MDLCQTGFYKTPRKSASLPCPFKVRLIQEIRSKTQEAEPGFSTRSKCLDLGYKTGHTGMTRILAGQDTGRWTDIVGEEKTQNEA